MYSDEYYLNQLSYFLVFIPIFARKYTIMITEELQKLYLAYTGVPAEKTVFKVIQVPKDRTLVKLRLGIATGEIKSVRPGKLDSGQQANRLSKQFFFIFGKDTRGTSFLYGMKSGQFN